jgi:hypothetical protein
LHQSFPFIGYRFIAYRPLPIASSATLIHSMRVHPATWVCMLFLISAGCGTPGAPQPPSLNLAKPVSDLKAVRTGNQVNLTWTVPTHTTDNATFRHRGDTKICRSVDQPQVDPCAPIATLPTQPNQKTGSFTADLPSGSAAPSDYATFAVEVDNDSGRNAGLSNQVQIPTAAASTLNGAPNVRLTPDAVLVTANLVPQDTTVQQVLELRRKEKTAQQESTVAQRTLELAAAGEAINVELRDETFAWEKSYEYRVVLVATAKVPHGNAVTFDAAASAPLEVITHDVFPPAIPNGVQAVFSGQFAGQQPSIDLTWSPNTDRDLAGYFVFRHKANEPESAAVKLNAQPITAPAYHDAAIEAGNTYLYAVSAIDERGNESKLSEEASEQVPK